MISDVLEVEHKWILALDPADSFLPRPSLNAKPLPANNTQVMTSDPVAGEHFCDPASCHIWAEFHTASPQRNKEQAQVDLYRAEQLWYYLGKTSTQFRAQFSNDPTVEVHNPKSVFINTSRPTGATRTSHLVASVSLTPSSSKIGLDSTHARGQEQQPQRQIADAQKVHEARPSKKRSGCEINPKSSDSTAAALLGARDRPSMSSTTADRLMGVTPSTANDPVTSAPSGAAGTVGRPSVVVPEGAPARPSVATTSTESEAATLDAVRSRISVPPEEGQLLLARQEPEQVIELQPGAYWSPQYGPLQRLGTLYQPLPRPPQTRHEPTVAVDPDSANFFERYPELGRIQNQAQSEYYKSPYVTTGGFSVDYLPRGSSTNPAIHSYIMHSPHQQMTYDQFFASFQPQASMMVNPLFDPQFALSSMPGAPNSTADPYMDHPATSGQNVAEMSSTAAAGFSMGHTAVLNGLTMMGGQDATDNLGNPYVNRSDNQYFED
ncbi:MAG: hypothetical protein M1825_005483 [Sarcosagium campestre]|nr:MAG: hypothetical protein M1825_005483 [Sarcosagium campestre]